MADYALNNSTDHRWAGLRLAVWASYNLFFILVCFCKDIFFFHDMFYLLFDSMMSIQGEKEESTLRKDKKQLIKFNQIIIIITDVMRCHLYTCLVKSLS